MKKRKEKSRSEKKLRTGPKFLTFLLVIALLSSVAVDCWCAYDLLGGSIKSDDGSDGSAKDEVELTEDELEAKAEREAEEAKEAEQLASGKFIFDSAVLGELDDPTVTDGYSAIGLLTGIQSELGINNAGEEYSFAHKDETESCDYYVLQQKYGGLEVSGSTLVIQTDKSGNVVDISGEYVPVEGLDTNVSVSRSDAEKAAAEYAEKEYDLEPGDYSIYNSVTKIFSIGSDEPTVGYEIEIRAGGFTLTYLAVDGNTGRVIGEMTGICLEMREETLDGQKEEQTLDVYRRSNKSYLLEDTNRGLRVYLYDRSSTPVYMSNMGSIPEAEWDPTEEDPDESCVDALANLEKTYDFYKDVFHITGVRDDKNFTLPVYVGIEMFENNNYSDNACMSGNQLMVVGVKDDFSTELSAELNVMTHEYTHGVVYTKSSLIKKEFSSSKGENAQSSVQYGINEGLADIFAELAEDYIKNGRLDGDCDWKNLVRDFASPTISDYDDFEEFVTDCHDSMSLVTYSFYLMAKRNGAAIDNLTLSNLYYNIISNLSSNTDFESFRRTLEVNAARMTAQHYITGPHMDGSTLTDEQLETVIDAFDAVGIPTSFAKTVVSGGTLKVYGKNDKIYDNYNIKLRRLFDTSVNILDEDVHEKSYSFPDSVPNGIYSVLLTDLNDPTLTETFNIVINDNASGQKVDKYPGTVRAYTDFGVVPRDVVLVLDVSGSMNGTPISQTKEAASKFIETVLFASPSTRISIVTYSGGVSVPVQMSNKSLKLLGAVSSIYSGGNTNTYAALETARSILDTSNTEKKTILLMSDGLPNEGENNSGDYSTPIISLADEIKSSGITIYTLGFFHNLSGGDLVNCQSLMSSIASTGYDYIVDNADDISFDVDNPESDLYRAFRDFAEMINGKKYINIRIACPVDVTVAYNGETLSSKDDELSTRASFGSLSFEKVIDENGEETDDVKILRLDESVNYEILINGTGRGEMDYTISYPDDEGEYTDVRKFKNIPITKDTEIFTATRRADKVKLNVDSDGDGKVDLKYSAGKDKSAEIDNSRTTLVIAAVSTVAALFLIFLIIKAVLLAKRVKRGGVCPLCGAKVEKGEKFCSVCGGETVGKSFYLVGRDEVRRQSKATIVVKLVLTVLCVGMSAAVIAVYSSAASDVFRQLKDKNTDVAKILYEGSVSDSSLSRFYLSKITENYIERSEAAYRNGKLSDGDYRALLTCVDDFDIGSASDKAEEYLEGLGEAPETVESGDATAE